MFKVNGGFRYPEDARKSLANPDPSPGQLLPNEYVERSRRMHANDVENIPLFLVAGLLYVCTSPSRWLAAGLFAHIRSLAPRPLPRFVNATVA